MSSSLSRERPVIGAGVVVLLAAGHFLALVDRALKSVYAPALKADFNLSDTQRGALQGLAFVSVVGLVVVITAACAASPTWTRLAAGSRAVSVTAAAAET